MDIESHRLVVLARDDSREGRDRLLAQLCAELLTDRVRAGRELDAFYEIAGLLLEKAGSAARRDFSERVAERSCCPVELLLRLAVDDIEVAEPVLLHALRLRENDLVDIASLRTEGHRVAIAQRAVVSAPVTRVLIGRGERDVLLRLGANRGAAVDEEGLRRLKHFAETDERMRRILAARDDLRPKAPRPPPAPPSEAPAPAPKRDAVDLLVAQARAGAITIEAVVTEMADADRQADLAAFLGRMAGVGDAAAMRVLVRRDADGIATLAAGLDVDSLAYDRIVELRRRKMRLGAAQVRWEHEAYREIDRAAARATLGQVSRHRATG
ncbi:MAG: DUF2336 domain-containing protein [Hyphomicrobiales bacterium]|nr:DUF2336 domain-containing protein [Hyphomicrobiales bacterium]